MTLAHDAHPTADPEPASLPLAELYLDLLADCLTRRLHPDTRRRVEFLRGSWQRALYAPIERLLALKAYGLYKHVAVNADVRQHGEDWPADAETMIGRLRLDNLRACVRQVVADRIPGDVIETGVWRGGAVIFMRGALRAYGDVSRRVWVADSFQGVPQPNAATYPADAGKDFWRADALAVSMAQVQENFRRYGLLDDAVQFLPGWFKDTLPRAPIAQVAVLRLDGDLYESTTDALTPLYPKLSSGGFCIIDDYGIDACRQAVTDYRTTHRIAVPLERIDRQSVFWRKP